MGPAARKADRSAGAVAEMIWNALDAEACQVEVEIQTNDIGGVERVIVRDDGHDMPAASCSSYFGDLGGSWKAAAKVSPNLQRTLHVRSGQGRLRACALGKLARKGAGHKGASPHSVHGRRVQAVVPLAVAARRQGVVPARASHWPGRSPADSWAL